MKVLVVTDSHNEFNNIYKIIENETPTHIIWTGDYSSDGLECSRIYTEIKFHIVNGNCDVFDSRFNDEEIIKLDNKKILLTHGHIYDVKRELNKLENIAKKYNVDAVCYGHTHLSYYKEIDGIKFFNPGAFKDGKYGILSIENGELAFEFKNLK